MQYIKGWCLKRVWMKKGVVKCNIKVKTLQKCTKKHVIYGYFALKKLKCEIILILFLLTA